MQPRDSPAQRRRPRVAPHGPAPSSASREGPLKSDEEPEREVEVLGARIAKLSAAVLRLDCSLELATLLQGGRRQCPQPARTTA